MTNARLRYVDAQRVGNSDFHVGTTVETAKGRPLGNLEGFVVDTRAGRLHYLVIGWRQLSGYKRKLVAFVPACVDAASGRLRLLVDDLRPDQWLEFDGSLYPAL